MATPSQNHVMFAAIDFGTTFTGFAFGLKNEIASGEVYASTWQSTSSKSQEGKAPTCLLLDPEKKFHHFGFKAEETYERLVEDSEADKWFFFEKFKMKLYETKKLSKNSEIEDHKGTKHKALEIFSIVIKYIKERAEKMMADRIGSFNPDDILWTLTVPAIWSDAAKQFMRLAANEAGIEDGDLKLILEPEAASTYVNNASKCRVVKVDGAIEFEKFAVGQKYIVADLGGGTADLAVHEVLEDGHLREISRSDGDAYGGIMVDKAFDNFLESLFGKEALEFLQREHNDKLIELRNHFKRKKSAFNMEHLKGVGIRLPIPKAVLQEFYGNDFQSKFEEITSKHKGKVNFFKDKMNINPQVIASFFDEAVDGIIKFVKELREAELNTVGAVNVLVMVGGFSESTYVQERIAQSIHGIKIIIPSDPSLAVLKGAVLLGHNPMTITERIARFTYGFSNAQLFDPKIHPESLKRVNGDIAYCTSIFCKVIEKGQVLKLGESFSELVRHECSRMEQRFMPIVSEVYRSNDKDPKFTTNEYGSTCVGSIIGFAPRSGWLPSSIVKESLVVGESEFKVIVTDLLAGRQIESKLDFLGEDDVSLDGLENLLNAQCKVS